VNATVDLHSSDVPKTTTEYRKQTNGFLQNTKVEEDYASNAGRITNFFFSFSQPVVPEITPG